MSSDTFRSYRKKLDDFFICCTKLGLHYFVDDDNNNTAVNIIRTFKNFTQSKMILNSKASYNSK